MIFKFSEFLCIPGCLTRMLNLKFQAVFEKKTEECASCLVINEKQKAVLEDLVMRTAIEKVWKMVKSQGILK